MDTNETEVGRQSFKEFCNFIFFRLM